MQIQNPFGPRLDPLQPRRCGPPSLGEATRQANEVLARARQELQSTGNVSRQTREELARAYENLQQAIGAHQGAEHNPYAPRPPSNDKEGAFVEEFVDAIQHHSAQQALRDLESFQRQLPKQPLGGGSFPDFGGPLGPAMPPQLDGLDGLDGRQEIERQRQQLLNDRVSPDRAGADVADVSERVRARRRQRRRRPDGAGPTPRQPRAGETPSNRTPLDEMEANIDEFKRDIERAFYEGMARALGNQARRAFEEGLGHLNPAEELEEAAGLPSAADVMSQARGEGVEPHRDPARLEPRDPGGSGRTGDLGRLRRANPEPRPIPTPPVQERPIQPPPSRG